jgi:hypothetical protein
MKTEKRCYRCREVKPIESFRFDRVKPDGYSGRCRPCDNIVRAARAKRQAQKDPVFAFKLRMRGVIASSFIRKGFKKNSQTEKVLGASFDMVREHFEKQFNNGMNWDNMGKWHVDHIIPLATAKTEDEVVKLCHYTNLQPLWAEDNWKKSDTIL